VRVKASIATVAVSGAYGPGGGSNYICVSDSPGWGNVSPVAKAASAPLYGVQYWLEPDYTNNNPLSYANNNNQDIHRQPAPCTACLSPNSNVLMIPGQTSGPGYMVTEYTGYIVANHWANYKSEYICLDGAPELAKTGGNYLPVELFWCWRNSLRDADVSTSVRAVQSGFLCCLLHLSFPFLPAKDRREKLLKKKWTNEHTHPHASA